MAGEERAGKEVGAAAVSAPRAPHLAACLPAPHGELGLGAGCSRRGELGKRPAAASSSSFAVPGSCQALFSDPRELGSGRPAPPWIPWRPRPGLASPGCPPVRRRRVAPLVGSAVLGLRGGEVGGEAPVKFSEPRAGVGVLLRGGGGVCLGGTLLFLFDSGPPGSGENPPR